MAGLEVVELVVGGKPRASSTMRWVSARNSLQLLALDQAGITR